MFELAIYGGTFAPVHNGHVHAAKAFLDTVKPDKLLIIPTLIPPHKQITFEDTPSDRLKMLHLAFKDEMLYGKKIFISDYELTAPAPSYTVNTLRHFSSPDTHITFLVGTDMFLTLDKWKSPDEIFSLCTVALMKRQSDDDNTLIEQKTEEYRNRFNADIVFIDVAPIEISSSDIRLADDEIKQRYLPKEVYQYIKERALYEDN